MTIASVGTRNSANSAKVAATTTTLVVGVSAIPVNNLLIVQVAIDNAATSDGETTQVTSITDTASNTYTRIAEYTNARTAANAGATISLWYTKVTTEIAIAGVITANHDSRTSRAITAWEFSMDAGNTIGIGTYQTDLGVALDPRSLTISGLTSREYLWLNGYAGEGPDPTYVKDADYTAFTQDGTTGGAGVTNMWVAGGWRIFTGTTDTYDAATTLDVDYAQVYAALYEIVPAAGWGGLLSHQRNQLVMGSG